MSKYGNIQIEFSLQEAQLIKDAIVDFRIHKEKLLKLKVRPVGVTKEQLQSQIKILTNLSKFFTKELSIKYSEGY